MVVAVVVVVVVYICCCCCRVRARCVRVSGPTSSPWMTIRQAGKVLKGQCLEIGPGFYKGTMPRDWARFFKWTVPRDWARFFKWTVPRDWASFLK